MIVGISSDESVREAYSADASGLRLLPEGVARPASADEVIEIVQQAATDRIPITCAGAQTSTTAASITDTGVVVSLRSLAEVGEVDVAARTITVGPGALIGDIKRIVAGHGLLFAPDPTSEEESTIGGAIACNASGARTFKYGATRRHIRSLKVVLASGRIVELTRSDLEKNTVGYAFAHEPIDWFIGSEGTLGVILEAELSLLSLPERVVGIAAFFPDETHALAFVVAARESTDVKPRCIEFFDEKALDIARVTSPDVSIVARASTMVYVEEEVSNLDVTLSRWLDLIEAVSPEIEPIVFDGEGRLREARKLRHSIPSTMNERAGRHKSAGGRKVSTDWAVPYRKLGKAIATAREIADQREVDQPVIYGHAGNGHPHQNFIASDPEQLATIEQVVEQTLRHVLSVGGTVAAEHGIGKIKKRWLPLQMNPLQISMMRAVKRELDPLGILAPGNIL